MIIRDLNEYIIMPEVKKAVNKMDIPVVLGTDFESNKIICRDVSKNNILIYGRPGSGKSHLLNLIIQSSMYLKDNIMFYLFDSRHDEFLMYKNFKNVKISKSLDFLTKELSRRRELFIDVNIREYKSRLQEIPYIMIVIDDYLDLNLDKSQVSKLLHILKIGRSFGVFVVCSNQRDKFYPDIKNQFTSVVCFENLIGRGIIKSTDSQSKDIISTFDIKKDMIYKKLLNKYKIN